MAGVVGPSQGMTKGRLARGRAAVPCDSFRLAFAVGLEAGLELRSLLSGSHLVSVGVGCNDGAMG